MERTVTPEWLDTLPADDPGARHSRRDLRIFNHAMGNTAWWDQTFPRHTRPGEPGIELGAGDGALACRLGLDALDRATAPTSWPAARTWHCADALQFNGWAAYPVVISNLVLHHFSAAELNTLGQSLALNARLILANEPARARRHQRLFALLCRAVGAHAVSRHDGHVSIAAGFRGDELPQLLGLSPDSWRWRINCTWRGAYRLVAERIDR